MDYADYELYVTSFYFSVTTIVTVGYGDITAISIGEKIVAVFLMITGVIAFSFATGALASIIQSQDSTEAKLKEKLATLGEVKRDYGIDDGLYKKIIRQIRYDHSKQAKDLSQFMDELPHKLKRNLAMTIYSKKFQHVQFFSRKESSFIIWVGTAIRPVKLEEGDYIYKEGEKILEMYFIVNGEVSYVLPRYNHAIYITSEKGSHFAHEDILGSRKLEESLDASQAPTVQYFSRTQTKQQQKSQEKEKSKLYRKFTVLVGRHCELISLNIVDLEKMRFEFTEVYAELHKDAKARLKHNLKAKKEQIDYQIKEEESKNLIA